MDRRLQPYHGQAGRKDGPWQRCSPCYSTLGFVILFFSKVTAVCDNNLPLTLAPVFKAINVLERTIPSRWDVVSRVTRPATCQNTFLASAPPARRMATALSTVRLSSIWKIQTAFELPESVISEVIFTLEFHL